MTGTTATVMDVEEKHRVAYQDVVTLLRKHTEHLSALEMLAVAANLVGKLVAMQDQRVTTVKDALETVEKNIQIGNREVLALLGSGEQRH